MSQVVKVLAEATGLRDWDIKRIIHNAPKKYKVFYIPKRNGDMRQIAQPSKALKYIQRAFVDSFLSTLPLHESATAYREGMSIKDNAAVHSGDGPILKMDFKDFFPSIVPSDWRSYCIERNLFSDIEDIYYSELLLFFKPKDQGNLRLSIGAPSSPLISNALMYRFDNQISTLVALDKVSYTRYADDLTFSAPRTGHLVNVRKQVSQVLKNLPYPNISLNDDKTTYVTRKYHRTVTGLTLSNDGRVTIGRDKKRNISAAIHKFKMDGMKSEDAARLSGTLAFVNSVEPEFILALKAKYGPELIDQLKRLGGKIKLTQ